MYFQDSYDMDEGDEDESEPDQSIWEPEMQHVDNDNVELPKPTVSLFISLIFFLNKNCKYKMYLCLKNNCLVPIANML